MLYYILTLSFLKFINDIMAHNIDADETSNHPEEL